MTERQTVPAYLCRCEEITVEAVREAIAEGARSINDVKRRTRAGMGICQGIYCVRPMAQIIHQETMIPLADIVPMTARPPARLVPLGLLAEMED
jgi:bacterioferritin-associated ferredoxin